MGGTQSLAADRPNGSNAHVSKGANKSPLETSDPVVELIKELTVGPLITGFIQGFASVGIAHWKSIRRARRLAKEEAIALSVNQDREGVPPFIGPQ
jgi:hypothetical protein